MWSVLFILLTLTYTKKTYLLYQPNSKSSRVKIRIRIRISFIFKVAKIQKNLQAGGGGGAGGTERWSADIWGLGCLIWEVYNGPLPAMDQLSRLADIPRALQPVYKVVVLAHYAGIIHRGLRHLNSVYRTVMAHFFCWLRDIPVSQASLILLLLINVQECFVPRHGPFFYFGLEPW